MELLFSLLVAHYIGDFPMQGEFLGTMKGKYDYLLFVHVIIWTGIICIVLAYFGIFMWWKACFLFIGHFFIDRWKARKIDKTNIFTKDLWIDQSLHIIQLIIIAFF